MIIGIFVALTLMVGQSNTNTNDSIKNTLQQESSQGTILLVVTCLDHTAVHQSVVSAYTNARFLHRVHVAVVVPSSNAHPKASSNTNTQFTQSADAVRHALESLGLFLWSTNVRWVESDAVYQSHDAAKALINLDSHYDLVLQVQDGVEFHPHWDMAAFTDFLHATKSHGTSKIMLSRPPHGFAAVTPTPDAITKLPKTVTLPCNIPMPMSSAWFCGSYALAPSFIFQQVPFDPYLNADDATAEVVYSARLHRAGVKLIHPANVPFSVVNSQETDKPCNLEGGKRLRAQIGLLQNYPYMLPESSLTPEELTAFSIYSGVDFFNGNVVGGAWGLTTDSSRREHLNKTGKMIS